MALFDTLTATAKKKKPKYFGEDNNPTGDLFSGLPTGEEDNQTQALVGKDLQGMLSGDAYDPSRTQQRETLQRAATNLRAQTGGKVAEGGFLGQGAANKAQQGTEQKIFQGLADTEMGMDVEEQAMKERGLGLATDIGTQQQDIVTQRRAQDIGLTQSREGNTSAEKIAQMGITSSEKIAANSIGLDYAKLTESARQFNTTTDQVAKQFKDTMSFNYDELDITQKQFLATLGLDKEKFQASKDQFQQQLEQTGRLTMAELGIEEKKIAEGSRQFNSRLEFDNSELAANLTEAEKNRVWQAVQNDKAAINTKEIATMQNDTERWKTDQTAILTKAGWTIEQAESALDRRLQETTQNKDIALQREIEQGRIAEAQAERLQQAEQFDDELAWNKEATRLGLSADEAARVWQTKERIGNQTFLAGESNLSRQLEKEIESGRLSIQEQELAQSAAQFDDQLDFNKSELAANLSEADRNRIWQSAENAKNQTFQANLQQIENEFTARGWSYQTLMASTENMSEEQVAQLMNDAAVKSGLSYAKTLDDGTEVTVPGLQTYKSTSTDVYGGWTPGKTVTAAQAKDLQSNIAKLAEDGKAITDTGIESMDPVAWTKSGANRWAITQEARDWAAANVGKPYQASNGRIYEVVGIRDPHKERNSKGSIVFKDIITGQTVNFTRGSGFPEA
jgi:hypothetical protein